MGDIDFGKGKVEYNELCIDISKSLEIQIEDFKEDMLQVKYCDDNNIYLLDVGWYPEFDLDGEFKIVVIKNYDWQNPLLVKNSNISGFYKAINESIYFVNKLLI